MMRFGPFSTRGGYDWTNLTIGDLIALNGIKETTETERVALHVNVARLETEDGAPIPLPPLHLHHFEVYTRWRGRVFLSITNDHLCADKPATGFECLGTDFGDYVMLFPLGGTTANSIVNDVRPRGSPPMSWWIRAAMLVSRHERDVSKRHVMSKYEISQVGLTKDSPPGYNPGVLVSNDVDSFFMFVGRGPPRHGRVVFTEFHGHTHQESWLLRGTPESLGIATLVAAARNNLCFQRAPQTMEEAGFASNTELKTQLLARLGTTMAPSAHAPPQVLFSYTSALLFVARSVDGGRFRLEQRADWQMAPNETITSITFTGPTPVAERAQGMVSEKPALAGHRSEHVFYTLYFTTGLDTTDVESDAFTPDWPRTCGMASMTWQGMRREGCHACRLGMPHGVWRNKTLT